MKFEKGKIYKSRSICDHSTVFAWEVVRVSEKSIWVQGDLIDGVKRLKICNHEEIGTYAKPLGTYSMSPSIYPHGAA